MFDINDLMINESKSINTSNNVLNSMIVEESYFLSAIAYVQESKNELKTYTKELYKSISETTEYDVVTESFSDFFAKVKEIITKFLNFIKSLFNRFIIALNKFVSSDKYIKKHKDDFKNFDTEKHNFKFDGYKFTLVSDVPVINALATFEQDFIDLDFSNLKDADKIVKEINAKYKALSDSLQFDFYDKFRALVMGNSEGSVSSSDYYDELFSLFRDGNNTKQELDITAADIHESLARFEGYKKFQDETKKIKDKIDKEYNQIEKAIQNMVYRNKDNDLTKLMSISVTDYNGSKVPLQVNNEIMAKIDVFIKAKVNQVIEMSNIHSLAFSYKLDAISDCYKQDKQILYTALNKMQKKPITK
jgi:hypothetical protein